MPPPDEANESEPDWSMDARELHRREMAEMHISFLEGSDKIGAMLEREVRVEVYEQERKSKGEDAEAPWADVEMTRSAVV